MEPTTGLLGWTSPMSDGQDAECCKLIVLGMQTLTPLVVPTTIANPERPSEQRRYEGRRTAEVLVLVYVSSSARKAVCVITSAGSPFGGTLYASDRRRCTSISGILGEAAISDAIFFILRNLRSPLATDRTRRVLYHLRWLIHSRASVYPSPSSALSPPSRSYQYRMIRESG